MEKRGKSDDSVGIHRETVSEISGLCPKPLMKKASNIITQKIEYNLVTSFSGTAELQTEMPGVSM